MKPTSTRLLAAGLLLVAVTWPLNWGLAGPRTHILFFPLWLGYVLVVQGLLVRRTGTSAWTRSRRRFAAEFLVSIPIWWVFELFNLRLRNWEYVGAERFGDLEYFVLCSIAFSTVVPAVLGTAELMRSFAWIERFGRGPAFRPTPRLRAGLLLAGLAMAAAMLVWPVQLYPLLWIAGVFVLEPVCLRIGRRSLSADLRNGDWRLWASLWSGVLVCAFFWEMWNVWSYPKWIYHVPGVDFAKVFEMPAIGYLGYLPFSLEVYLVRQILMPER